LRKNLKEKIFQSSQSSTKVDMEEEEEEEEEAEEETQSNRKRGPYRTYLHKGKKPPKTTLYNRKLKKNQRRDLDELIKKENQKGQSEIEGEGKEGKEREEGEEDFGGLEFSEENEDIPLYPGASIKVTESFVVLMNYILKHCISNPGIEDLVKGISLLLPKNHHLAHSKYFFKKFFKDLEQEPIFHYYCSRCWKTLSSKAENCARCKEKFEENDLKYFLEVPIEQQIRQFFKIEEFYQGIHYPFMRKKKVSENLEDFLDSTAYKS